MHNGCRYLSSIFDVVDWIDNQKRMRAAFHAARYLTRISHQSIFHVRVKPESIPITFKLSAFRSYSRTTIMSSESLVQSLANISVNHAGIVSHQATSSPASWREALSASSSTPKSFSLLKTIVYKPKTAKSAVPIPVVVVAREETEINSSVLGKKFNLKELRLASGDLLTEFFSLDKDSCKFSLDIVHALLVLNDIKCPLLL
jgi:hypothetical protein